MQCGSWYCSTLASRLSTTSRPFTSDAHVRPASVDSNTPPLDIAGYRCCLSRGSTSTECSLGPSGVPFSTAPIHLLYSGCSFMPATPVHVAPPSSLRNSPCGEVPAYHVPLSLACPGVSQNVWSTTCPFCPSGAFGNAGGRVASFHVLPESCERNTVGPRCPVRAASSSVRGSRGSCTTWCTMCPRKIGSLMRQPLRLPSDLSRKAPLRVATSRATGPDAELAWATDFLERETAFFMAWSGVRGAQRDAGDRSYPPIHRAASRRRNSDREDSVSGPAIPSLPAETCRS